MKEFDDALLDILRGFGNQLPWWRGVDAPWPLVPSLYWRLLADAEVSMNTRFRDMAMSRYPQCPSPTDLFGWLSLLQHYRLPTRLLDWSESPLVGLFFALKASGAASGEDAVLWALLPTELSRAEIPGRTAILSSQSSDIATLLHNAFFRDGPSDARILSVSPPQVELRHMVQHSVFTLHGRDTPIDALPGADSFLAQIRIPVTAKLGFSQMLSLYGVSQASLFPDLDNLAQELATLRYRPIEEDG